MSILDLFRKQPKRFITEAGHQKNLAFHLKTSPQTVEQLRSFGVTDDSHLKLEFFFYTNTIEKAQGLAEKLEAQNYVVEYGESAGNKKIQIITGWTTPIQMTTEKVLEWTGLMCNLGYEHDCEFDGWGTNPKQ